MKKLILGLRFSFESYTKNVREKATRCSLMFYWILMDTYSPKFDTHQGTVVPNYFKSHTNF